MKSRYYCILIPAFIMLVLYGCKSGSIQNETLQPADDVEVDSHAPDEKEKMLDAALKMSGKKITAEERNAALRMLNLSEDDLINGLNVFAELSDGRYPSRLDTKTTLKETDGLGAEKVRDMSEYERKQKVQDIFFASVYYDKLQRQKKDVEYYGDKVTAKDNDKILIRWKTGKDKYRIVFGDLSTENVLTKRLSELEK
ncbi:MAG: hypothetical protein ACYSYV_01530 [Planctomycetota bacterium]